MGASRLNFRAILLFGLGLAFAAAVAARENSSSPASRASLSLDELSEKLQTCSVVQDLNAEKLQSASETSTLTSQIFAVLFPSSPAINALLATLYISGPPNFLLALCPPNIDPSSLSVMVAFAVGGLLGDTLFHLLPEIFLGEDSPEHVRFVLVEPNRNLLLGVAIMVGFMTFVAMDKGLRIATGGEGHEHSHGGHEHSVPAKDKAISSSVEVANSEVSKRRKGEKGAVEVPKQDAEKEISASVKLGGYLNLIADFTHNITDGLAMSASFYASPTIGATTTVAVFFHEIPHEVGDFALLVQSGFSKRAAMGAQFVTALGALLGTLIGIAVQEFGGSSTSADGTGIGMTAGLLGTSLTYGDLLLPFTAGTFLYVGTVAVIPELLETGPNKSAELRKMIVQFAAIALGAGIMLYISWD
ncbi:Zip-domain-containing protein [Annulohypoxylon nitens]|nr:Zip-domain-containing protein [Annulohypoxylon nitens]